MSTDEKQAALDAAGAASSEDEQKDALDHVNAALANHPDDEDLVTAKGDLSRALGLVDEAPAANTGGPPPGGSPPEPPPADTPPPPVEEETPAPPVELTVPVHTPEVGGWPNDWPVWKPNEKVRAKQIDQDFVIAGIKGDAGDYIVLLINEHDEVADIGVQKAEHFETVYEVQP